MQKITKLSVSYSMINDCVIDYCITNYIIMNDCVIDVCIMSDSELDYRIMND